MGIIFSFKFSWLIGEKFSKEMCKCCTIRCSFPSPSCTIFRVHIEFCTWSCTTGAKVVFTGSRSSLLSNIAYHILEGVHFLLLGGSPSCRSAWARWVTRNRRELVTLFLASLADTFALQQLTQHSGYWVNMAALILNATQTRCAYCCHQCAPRNLCAAD